MSFTNLTLQRWDGEWPEYIEVSHEGTGDLMRYVPERTCHYEGDERTMINVAERREVARRLRKLEIGVTGSITTMGTLAKNILDAIKYGHSDAMTPYGLLAELIDPDCRHEKYCKVCGHVIPEGWGECPRCRSKVVSNDNR